VVDTGKLRRSRERELVMVSAVGFNAATQLQLCV
jgi:hypothetical protein